MLKKIILSLVVASAAYIPFLGNSANAAEDAQIARINWNININTGIYPFYCAPCPYYPPYYNPFLCPCVPPCYGYPPPPYWVW